MRGAADAQTELIPRLCGFLGRAAFVDKVREHALRQISHYLDLLALSSTVPCRHKVRALRFLPALGWRHPRLARSQPHCAGFLPRQFNRIGSSGLVETRATAH